MNSSSLGSDSESLPCQWLSESESASPATVALHLVCMRVQQGGASGLPLPVHWQWKGDFKVSEFYVPVTIAGRVPVAA